MSESTWLHSVSQYLFWDIPIESLDVQIHSGQIIERVVQRGTWQDFKLLLKHYDKETIKEKLKQARFLDDRTLNFCSLYFEISKADFRCYMLKQLHPPHFSY
jgi:hypothetical protein